MFLNEDILSILIQLNLAKEKYLPLSPMYHNTFSFEIDSIPIDGLRFYLFPNGKFILLTSV